MFIYLTFFHCWLLPALGAVPRHDASPQALAVARPLLHGVGSGMVAAAVRGAAALCQAELLAQDAVLLLHLPHADLQALPLARGRVPRAVGLGFKRRQRHRLPICKRGKRNAPVRIHSKLRFPLVSASRGRDVFKIQLRFMQTWHLKAMLKCVVDLDKG